MVEVVIVCADICIRIHKWVAAIIVMVEMFIVVGVIMVVVVIMC